MNDCKHLDCQARGVSHICDYCTRNSFSFAEPKRDYFTLACSVCGESIKEHKITVLNKGEK